MAFQVSTLRRLRPFLPALIAVVIGLVLTVFATRTVHDNETSRIRLEFDRRAENHLRALEHGMAERVRLIENLRALFGTTNTGRREDFEAFLSQVDFVWSNAKALAWMPALSAEEGQGVPSFLCQPEPACGVLLGGSVLSGSDWRLASRRVRQAGKTTAFILIEGAPDLEAMLGIVAPLFPGGAGASPPRSAELLLTGYIVGVFSIPGMVENILSAQTAPSGLDAYLFKEIDARPGELLYFHESRSTTLSRSPPTRDELFGSASFIRDFKIADQELMVVFHPVPEAVQRLKSNETIEVLVFGILVTALLSVYLALSVRRTSKIEELVTARTAELHDAYTALRAQTSMVQFLRTIATRANEASSIDEALETALGEVCRFIGWPAGHAYSVTANGAGRLRSTGVWWVREGVEIGRLKAATSMAELHRGEGLPGKVWASGHAVWSEEFGTKTQDPRSEAAAADGIRTSFGLPIRGGADVAAVLEFFSLENEPLDPAFAQALDFIGVQLGRVVERGTAEERLRAARDQAEQANVAKSKFLAAASHDLRQPLQAMNLFVNVLSGRNWDRESRDILGHLKDSVSSLEGLLSALLNISKLEAGLIVPEKRDFKLSDVFQRLETEFRPLFEKARLRMGVVTPSLAVHSDPVLLERILRNLLANALRYTETGHVLLGARRHGASLRVGVWDTGIGIAKDQQAAIFQEFYQVARGNGEEQEGAGLGLAIVTRLGKLLGHEIDVRSEPGRGSAFTLEIPLAENATSLSAPRAEEAASPSPFSMSGKVVMVIDDEEKVRLAVRYQLESWGGKVLTAASVGEALALISKRVPDLILADYRLGRGETGQQAIRALREHVSKEIPGILLTGDTDPKRLKKAEESGLKLLHKPVPTETLQAAIEVELG